MKPWQSGKRIRQLTERRLLPAVTTHPLVGCDRKLQCIGAPGPRELPPYVTGRSLLERVGIFHGREGVVAQQMGGGTGPWVLVCTPPGLEPRILGWV